MTNQELSKVAQAAAYVDVLVNAGIIDSETENFCINKVKQLLDELLKEENKVQISGPTYRNMIIDCKDDVYKDTMTIGHKDAVLQEYSVNPFTDQISTTTGLHPDHSTITTACNM